MTETSDNPSHRGLLDGNADGLVPADRGSTAVRPDPGSAGESKGRWVSLLETLAPWIVGIGALAYVAWWVPIGLVLSQMGRTQLVGVPLVVGLGVGALFVADAYAFFVNMGIFGVPLSFRGALRVRGLSYSLAAVNYHLGQGSLVYLVSRATNQDLFTCTGAVIGAMGVQFLVLFSVAIVGVGADASGALAPLRPYAVAGALGMAAFFVMLALRPSFLASWRLTKPVVQAGPMGLLKAMAARIPHTLVLFGLNWTVMALFGIRPPLGDGLVRLSAVFFVVALPISVQGLGTGQAAAALLLSPFAEAGRPAVVAYSLSVWALAVVFQLAIGLPFLFSGRHRVSAHRGGNTDVDRSLSTH